MVALVIAAVAEVQLRSSGVGPVCCSFVQQLLAPVSLDLLA